MGIFRNSIYIIDGSSLDKISSEDSVFVIGDTLFNRSHYAPVLISNSPSTEEKAKTFYKGEKIPFPIYNAMDAGIYLRGMFQELSTLVDNKPWI